MKFDLTPTIIFLIFYFIFSGKLFKCFQVPLHDIRTWLRPDDLPLASSTSGLRTSSPMERGISYIDDPSSSSEDEEFNDLPIAEVSLSSTNSGVPPTSSRAFSSDSGYVIEELKLNDDKINEKNYSSSTSFSSEIGDQRRSHSYETGGGGGGCSSRKISESSSDAQRTNGGFNRTKWTSSFRRLLGRKPRVKKNTDK